MYCVPRGRKARSRTQRKQPTQPIDAEPEIDQQRAPVRASTVTGILKSMPHLPQIYCQAPRLNITGCTLVQNSMSSKVPRCSSAGTEQARRVLEQLRVEAGIERIKH
ncbi:hypothetical protein NDU88_004324 [Pleurodeles waltl]|uniref:Uncharacterized protein n=1 Tax=Pleurodeles waltl TaxID=8319 RepID=A0AAV7T7B5_PLEWA|nr:hypothetical protein NDU88_004324 [Pleurodeles waltl]